MKNLPHIILLAGLVTGSLLAAYGESNARRVEAVSAYAPADPASLLPSRTYFTSTAATEKEMLQFRRELIERGASHVNFFPPDVIVCELPMDLEVTALSSFPAVLRTEEASVVPYRASGGSGKESLARLCYQRADLTMQAPVTTSHHAAVDDGFKDVVLTIPAEKCREVQRQLVDAGALAEDERGVRQNAEFLGGDVLVLLVLPESNGEIELQSENWPAEALTDAVSGAVAGMLTVQQHVPYMPLHYVFKDFQKVPTGYEPIKHMMDDDYLWIIDTMRRLDPTLVANEALAIVHEFNCKKRRQYGTDFVYTGFIANSENAPGHVFQNSFYTAYANLGGPYNVQPFPAGRDPNNIGDWMVFSQIFEHESGHIFWALDEYINEDLDCKRRSGYLNGINSNKLFEVPLTGEIRNCVPPIRPCLMKSARTIEGRPWCEFTRRQMGISDGNDNSIPDIYESRPIVEFETAWPETVLTDEATIKFKAISTAVPNNNQSSYIPQENRIDYAAPLKEGRFNVFGTGDNAFVPLDGKWDEVEEEAAIRITSLPSGLFTVSIKVKNAVGMWSQNSYSKTVFFIGINYSRETVSVVPGSNLVEWNVAGQSFGAKFDVYRMGPGEDMPGQRVAEDVLPLGPPENGAVPYRYTDRDIEPGVTYRYYAEARFTLIIDREPRDFTYRSAVFKQTAMYTIPTGTLISNAAPNPFRERIGVSIRVPPTYGDIKTGGASGVSQLFASRRATNVKVAVFDVLGRHVKTLRSGGEFSDILTLSWDGTNADNQRVPSGIYFLKAQAGEFTGVQKIVLIR